MRGRHQLQLNRNMTKVNAPRASQGRAQREPVVRARANQWGASKPTVQRPASSGRGALLIVRAFYRIGFRCAGTTDGSLPRPLCTTSHAPGMHDCHVRCPSGAVRTESEPQTRTVRRREREGGRESGLPTDCKRQPGPRVIATRTVTFRIKPER